MVRARGREGDEFVAFVRGSSASLHRTAYLLTGDGASARHLTTVALARTRRSWRRVMETDVPELHALRVLVRAYVRQPLRTPHSADLELIVRPDGADREQGLLRDAFWSALGALPPRERAVVVLDQAPQELGWWIEVDAGEVLGIGRNRLAALTASAGRTLSETGVDASVDLVRETLAERAAAVSSVAGSADVLNATQVAVARHRHRHRQLAVVGVVALLGIGSAWVVARGSASHQAVGESSPTPAVTSTRRPPPDVEPLFNWPVRGSLADDEPFLTALKVTFTRNSPTLQGAIQVLYAGDLDTGGRIGLVVGRTAGGGVAQWYVGDTDADASRLSMVPAVMTDVGPLPTVLRLPGPRFVLVALMPPDGSALEISWRPSFPSDGSVHRSYEPLPATDGVVALDVTDRNVLSAKVRTVDADGGRTGSGIAGLDRYVEPGGDLAWPSDEELRAQLGAIDPAVVRSSLAQLGQTLGIEAASDLTARVVWSRTQGETTTVVLRVRLRGGGEFLVVGDDYYFDVPARTVPAGTPDLPVAWVSVLGSSVSAVAPSGVARVEVRVGTSVQDGADISPGTGPQLVTLSHVNMLTLDDAKLLMLDAAGRVVWTWPLSDHAATDLSGSGPGAVVDN